MATDPRKKENPGDVNSIIQDRVIRHLLYLVRLSTQEANWLREQFEENLFPDLRDHLAAGVNRLKEMSAEGGIITQAQAAQIATLRSQISQTTSSFATSIRETFMGRLSDIATQEADFEQRLFEKTIPIEWDFEKPTKQRLESILQSQPFDGKPLNEWFDDLSQNTTDQLTRAVRQGTIEGESMDDIMRRVRGTQGQNFTDGILNMTRHHAEALGRSGVMFASDEATSEMYRQNDDIIKGVKVILTLDSRTCLRCVSAADDNPYELDNAPVLPIHLRCRCGKAPVTKSWRELGIDMDEAPESTRASMNGQVPEDMTYNQWLKGQPDEVVEEALGPTRAKLFKQGDLELSAFTDRQGRSFTLEQLRERESDIFDGLFDDDVDVQEISIFDDRSRLGRGVELSDIDEEARDRVVSLGLDDNNEYASLVDDEEIIENLTSGSKSSVTFNDDILEMLDDSSNNIRIHHNHPEEVPLSPADFLMTSRSGARDILAYTNSGSTFQGSLKLTDRAFKQQYNSIYKTLVRELRKHKRRNDDLTILQANFLAQHYSLLKLRKDGIIDYNIMLSGLHKDWIQRFDDEGLFDNLKDRF